MSFAEDMIISNQALIEKFIPREATNVEQQLIKEDTTYLSNIGIEAKNLQGIKIYEDGIEYVYLMDNGTESSIIISRTGNGTIVYSVTENGLKDEIVMLNGKLLTIDGKSIDSMTETIESYPRSISYETETCPRGVPSEYNDYVRTMRKSNIPLEKELVKHTTNGLAIFLSGISGHFFLLQYVIILQHS